MQTSQGRLDEASTTLDRAQQLNQELYPAVHPHVARSLQNRAWLLAKQRRFADAVEQTHAALEIRKAAGDRFGFMQSLHHLGRYLQRSGQYAESRRAYDQALSIARALDAPAYELAAGLDGLARALHHLGESELARAHATHGNALLEDVNATNADLKGQLLLTLAQIEVTRGNPADAAQLGHQAYATLLQAGLRDPDTEQQVRALLAGLPSQ